MASYNYTFTSGDTVTPTKLNNARTVSDIVNADIKSDAAIAGTKIAPNFGSQNIVTTGNAGIGTGSPASSFGKSIHLFNDANTGTVASNSYFLVESQNRNAIIELSGISTATNALTFSDVVGSPVSGVACEVANSNLILRTGGTTERMRITEAGNVSIGTTETLSVGAGSADGTTIYTGGAIHVSTNNETSLFIRRRAGNGNSVGFYRDTTLVGTISVTTTATAYNTSSDYRLKENATPLIGGLATIDQLQPCEFTWKSDGSLGRGFIAHELQAVVPEAVTGEKDAVDGEGNPQYQGVDAAKLVPYLVSAVKELKARVEALEAAQ
jgi:hypothetical protein